MEQYTEEDKKFEEDFKKEVLKNSKKELSKEELNKMMEDAKTSINFLEKIDEVELPKDKYVIFTDGNEQLYYENGEFYIISSTDSKATRKKKTKQEARDMYLEFFIKYGLNPILDQRDIKRDNQLQKSVNQKQVVKAKKEITTEQIDVEKKEQKQVKIEKEDRTL